MVKLLGYVQREKWLKSDIHTPLSSSRYLDMADKMAQIRTTGGDTKGLCGGNDHRKNSRL